MHFLHKVKYNYEKLKFRNVNRAFVQEHPEVALPPDYILFEAYYLNYAQYYNDGKTTAKELVDLLAEFTDFENKNVAIQLYPNPVSDQFTVEIPFEIGDSIAFKVSYFRYCEIVKQWMSYPVPDWIESSQASAGIPTDLPSCLCQLGFQDVAGGSPDMSIAKSLVVTGSLSHQFDGSYSTLSVWGVIE